MPRSTNPSLRCAIAACAAAAILAGCFGPDPQEDLYTEPAGRQFEQLHFLFDGSGTPHILAVESMMFRRSGPLEPWETEAPVTTRNYQALHYTRSAGGFTLHPFQNLQNHDYAFPTLLADTTGAAHAFVSDNERIRQFRLGPGKPAHIGDLKQVQDGIFYTNDTPNYHTGRPADFALGSASTLIGVQRDSRTGEISILDGSRRVRLETKVNPRAVLLEATPSFRLLVAVENASYPGDGRQPDFEPRTVGFLWKAGDTTAARQELWHEGSDMALLSRYRHGYRLHLRARPWISDPQQRSRLVAIELEPTGMAHGGYPLVLPDWLQHAPDFFDADADGCLHGITTAAPSNGGDTSIDAVPHGSGLYAPWKDRGITFRSWNSCRPEWIDSLVIPPPADTALTISYTATRFRLDAEGRPGMALIVRNSSMIDPLQNLSRVENTWIGLAGYREGGWRIDTLDVKQSLRFFPL